MFKKAIGILLMFSYFSIIGASPLKSDEDVWFFPTSANFSAGENTEENSWNIPIHHWVFEKEEKSLTRKITQKLLSEVIESIGVTEEEADSPIFHQRLMWFLVDNERGKQIEICFNKPFVTNATKNGTKKKPIKLAITNPNGHATTHVKFEGAAKAGDWVTYSVIDPTKPHRKFTGKTQLIPEEGLSVISDVDDTIKISEVLDKKVLIKNTFVKPYKTTEGFPEYYKALAKQGAYFHYVSASPWQLQPSLKPFMDAHYPKGTIALRNFRLKDSSLLDFLKSSAEYKIDQIKSIIERYPKHHFILIGDSGEHDPDVYAKIYQLFPKNIKAIQIRAVKGSDLTDQRFEKVFSAVPKTLWQVFDKPSF